MKVLLALSFINEIDGDETVDGGSDDEKVFYNSSEGNVSSDGEHIDEDLFFSTRGHELRQDNTLSSNVMYEEDHIPCRHSNRRDERIENTNPLQDTPHSINS